MIFWILTPVPPGFSLRQHTYNVPETSPTPAAPRECSSAVLHIHPPPPSPPPNASAPHAGHFPHSQSAGTVRDWPRGLISHCWSARPRTWVPLFLGGVGGVVGGGVKTSLRIVAAVCVFGPHRRILVGIYCHNIPTHTPQSGYHGVTKVAKTANIPKMAEKVHKLHERSSQPAPYKPHGVGTRKHFFGSKSKKTKRFMIFDQKNGGSFF